MVRLAVWAAAILLGVLLLVGCGGGKSDEQDIKQLFGDLTRAVNDRNTDEAARLFSKDCTGIQGAVASSFNLLDAQGVDLQVSVRGNITNPKQDSAEVAVSRLVLPEGEGEGFQTEIHMVRVVKEAGEWKLADCELLTLYDVPSPGATIAPSATPVGTAEAIPFGKIAFSRRDVKDQIYVLTPEGERNVSNGPTEDSEPSLSPDGEKIAFASDRDGTFRIYVVNVDGSGLVKLTNASAGDLSPTWSPDGKQIAFSRAASLYIMDSDGSNVRQVTEAEPSASAPPCKGGAILGSWSPDGKRLVFYAPSLERQLGQICTIGSDGSDLTVVASEPPAWHVEPSWSPDGEWIVYRFIDKGPSPAAEDDNHEIYLVKPDGTSRTNLTNDPATDIEPSWSPDGQWIVFSSDRTGGFDLYIMKPDGSDLKRLTTDPFKDSYPSWGP